MSSLGLDIGTSGCKAVVFDDYGRSRGSASSEYAINRPKPGWAELDSSAVGDACLDCIRRAATSSGGAPIQSLAISSQGEAFTVLDKEGRILANAMVSSDCRAAMLAESWPREFGVARLYEKTGHTAHPIFTLFKLLWLRQEKPDLWQKAARILCFEDYLHYRLGIEPALGWSLAARTMLFNVRNKCWDPEILAAVGLKVEQLARPMPSGKIAGILPDAMAASLGLAQGACVVTGGHDQVCAALGAGAVGPGQAVLATGTVECVTVAFQNPIFDPILQEANLCTYAHAAPGLHATLAYNLTGGNLLRWFRDQWSLPEKSEAARTGADVYELIFNCMPERPTRLMVIPYFTASGTPHFDSHTPGAILGLRLETTRGEVLRALMEGLAFELRENFSLLERAGIHVREIRAVGGGARNLAWLQLKADVLNRPISRPAESEAGCLGNALLAYAAISGCDPNQQLSKWVPLQDTIQPDPERAAYYIARSRAYVQSYEAMRTLANLIF